MRLWAVVSSTPGISASMATVRPKPPLSLGPMPTSTVMAVSVRVIFCLAATSLRALWKQAA